ncbi:glycosyltransferase family 1 protein [Aplosporella prunicola CBS 121167]|uniref:Glycosyltransferase family 1 protein n=1 Tax=Aplosporella prunicola CBS 121167 TaxID=1176127 RepID=A0A6A6AXR6_9PEZI|nr:glycosyltransferase family 1 protein [Aplosporella prunicola CBS 121167]KAF2135567.1 glycosyltransferase family 1 protein [Aplosporella prunicola CBS 121167]
MTILLVVGYGGFTHAAPILELGRILAARGHRIEFATHQGQEQWTQDADYSFVARTHTMGASLPPAASDAHYLRMQQSDMRVDADEWLRPMHTVEGFWAADYAHLTHEVIPACRPDIIVADFFVDAARDVQIQLGIPIAVVWPQMPYGMLNVSYIPGMPGFQLDALTSEHASLWTRLRAELRPLGALPAIFRFLRFTKKMRDGAGVHYMLPVLNKPNYLILVNSFWGLETPKDLPPLVAAVGPILSEEYPPLEKSFLGFYNTHSRVLYVAFGTHIRILPPDLTKFITAITTTLRDGLIDGVIWAANETQMGLFNRSEGVVGEEHTVGDLVDNNHPSWLFTPFAPQRAILEHENTVLFLSHGGGSSANEGLFHGTPMLTLGFYFDQTQNGMRLTDADVGLALDKLGFSTEEVIDKMRWILRDEGGTVAQNVTRMRHIARVSARKKHHGADLIEEVMYDHHFSLEVPGAGASTAEFSKRRRPMHLETADMRMSAWRARNWDLTLLGLLGGASVVAVVYGIRTQWTLLARELRSSFAFVQELLRR